MTDIVKRLRSADVLIVKSAEDLRSVVAEEAAAEIEKLRAENANLAASNHAYLSDYQEAADEIERLRAENEKLRAALQSVLNACDQGRMLERGAGGMTIDAQISRSFYYGVPAWPIEEARAALGEKE